MGVSDSWHGSDSGSDAMVVKWSVVQCRNFGKTDIIGKGTERKPNKEEPDQREPYFP